MPDATEASPPPGDESDGVSFEAALARLEQIVVRLEAGDLELEAALTVFEEDLELEAALTVFEEGVGLSRRCATRLEAAQRRIETLVGQGEDWVARGLDAEEEPD